MSASIISCGDRLVDPQLSSVTQRINPPLVYQKWWAETEACSGKKGDLSKITWYDTPETTLYVDGEGATAYYSSASNRIVLTRNVELDGQIVRHEMLHAIIREKGHPRDQFLGKCRGVVHCNSGCIAPEQDYAPAASWPRLPSENFSVSVSVNPAQPSMAIDSGFFQVIVEVRNTRTNGVVATMPTITPGVPPYCFSASLGGPNGGPGDGRYPTDYSSLVFQPGEIKREIFDFSLGATPKRGALPQGRYRITGKYGAVVTPPIILDLPGG